MKQKWPLAKLVVHGKLHVNSLQQLFLGGIPDGFAVKRIPVSGVLLMSSCLVCHARSSFSGEGGEREEVKGRGKEGGRSLLNSEMTGEWRKKIVLMWQGFTEEFVHW